MWQRTPGPPVAAAAETTRPPKLCPIRCDLDRRKVRPNRRDERSQSPLPHQAGTLLHLIVRRVVQRVARAGQHPAKDVPQSFRLPGFTARCGTAAEVGGRAPLRIRRLEIIVASRAQALDQLVCRRG